VLFVIGKQNKCLFCLPITDNTNFDIYGVFVCLFCLLITDNTNFDIYGFLFVLSKLVSSVIGKQNKQTKTHRYKN
jgi:hypothetical protein